MNDYYIYCLISGEDFTPSLFVNEAKDFIIESINDKNDVEFISENTMFRYELGNLTLIPKDKINENFELVFLDFLTNLIKLRKKLSTSLSFTVHLNIAYETQCNFELSPNEINHLRTLNATFTLTCYQKGN